MNFINPAVVDFKVPVIYYHSVGPSNPGWYRNFLTLSPDIFENHVGYFAKKYSTITLNDYWHIINGHSKPVCNPLIITFDDGYRDILMWAFPILKKYGLKATIFISPEYVDERNESRLINEVPGGFLSWDEMKLMESSGLIDVQSHTMTHTKYIVSEKIIDFHNPKSDFLYPISNMFPAEKPYYIGNRDFKNLIPFGYPFFEDASSVIARRLEINPEFINLCIDLLKNYDFNSYNFLNTFKIVKPHYNKYRQKNKLIAKYETEEDFKDRLRYEIIESKRVIEEKLEKEVHFLCWPHGDNNEFLHQMALDAGYIMTTLGKVQDVKKLNMTRIPERTGVDFSNFWKKQKMIMKLKGLSGKFPYCEFMKTGRYIRTLISISVF